MTLRGAMMAAVMVCLAPAALAEEPAKCEWRSVTIDRRPGNYLAIRAAPDVGAAKVGELHDRFATIKVCRIANGWGWVGFFKDGRRIEGWVSTYYLAEIALAGRG